MYVASRHNGYVGRNGYVGHTYTHVRTRTHAQTLFPLAGTCTRLREEMHKQKRVVEALTADKRALGSLRCHLDAVIAALDVTARPLPP